jgi:hypothetical protein
VEAFPVKAFPVEAFPVEAFPVEAFPAEAFPAEAFLAEAFPAEAFPVEAETFHVEAFPVEAETFHAEAFPVEAYLAAEACLAADGASLAAGGNKENFLVEAAAYAFQGKAAASSLRSDNIERRRVAVASYRAWVDPGAEVSVRGAAGLSFAVAAAFVAVAAASISGARDKVTSED